MKRGACLVAAVALGLAAAPAWAQADRARLDDFAVPQVAAGATIDQVDGKPDRMAAEPAPPSDRQLGVPGPAIADRAPLAQLSRPDEGGTTRQLSDTSQSRDVASGSVSTSRDSRPQDTAALAGSDRCDPQADRERPADCERILERRAAEFDATEPPRLSAEQVLLAASEEDDDALAANSSRVRLRLASTGNPDADLQSNQELAAIYYRRASDQPQQPQEDEPTVEAGLAELLQTLQINVAGPSAP